MKQLGNSQFYDKLFVRREIALLLKHLRSFEEFVASLKQESRCVSVSSSLVSSCDFTNLLSTTRNTQQFVKFVHMLLGDAQYLVDEILLKLKEINHTIQEMQDQDSWNRMDEGSLFELLPLSLTYLRAPTRFETRTRANTQAHREPS